MRTAPSAHKGEQKKEIASWGKGIVPPKHEEILLNLGILVFCREDQPSRKNAACHR